VTLPAGDATLLEGPVTELEFWQARAASATARKKVGNRVRLRAVERMDNSLFAFKGVTPRPASQAEREDFQLPLVRAGASGSRRRACRRGGSGSSRRG